MTRDFTDEDRILTDEEDHYAAKIIRGGLIECDEPDAWPVGKLRVRAILDNGQIQILIDNPPTQQADQILLWVLPEILELFLKKNKDYGEDAAMSLGVRAEFVEIWRKANKLKRSIWENKELEGEQTDEILMDLVGHCMLALLYFQGRTGYNQTREVR